jgi:hypothetical protein
MSNAQSMKLPVWFWVIAGIAVVWNLMGVYAYWMDATMTEEALSALPEAERNLRAATPAWVTGAYAIAVFCGLLGSVALAVRKNWAVPLFGVSFVAVVVQMGFVLFGMNAISILGASAAVFPVIIFLIAAFLAWFSMDAKKKGWIS